MLVESSDGSDLWRFAKLDRSFVFVGLSNCKACTAMKEALAITFKERSEPDLLMFHLAEPDEDTSAFLNEYLAGKFPQLLYFVGGERKRRWIGFFGREDFETKVRSLTEIIDSCNA
jgi:hypothetical protein